MIDELRSMKEATFEDFLKRAEIEQKATDQQSADQEPTDQDRPGDWRRIAAACEVLPTATLTPAVIDAWLPKVARYSFHPIEV